MQALNKQALRILKLFGNDNVKHVTTSVGPEQEYFLIPKELYDKRKDLIYTGRTLFGAKPPKGQELDDHYFGVIKPRVEEYMSDLNDELWKLGILAKTQHNEVAPAQHELAPIYATTNIATDHNQLTMEIMQTRKAVRKCQRFGQAQQLVYRHRHRSKPADTRRNTLRECSVPAFPVRCYQGC